MTRTRKNYTINFRLDKDTYAKITELGQVPPGYGASEVLRQLIIVAYAVYKNGPPAPPQAIKKN